MEIRLNEYRGFIIKMLLPFWVIILLTIISMIIGYLVVPNDMQDCLYLLIGYVVGLIIISIIMILVKFVKPSEWYIFDEKTIKICNKKGVTDEINVSEVEIIKYRPFRFRYIVTIFFGELNECGAWRLYIKFKNGETKTVGFFDLKRVMNIKTLYGELVTIC